MQAGPSLELWQVAGHTRPGAGPPLVLLRFGCAGVTRGAAARMPLQKYACAVAASVLLLLAATAASAEARQQDAEPAERTAARGLLLFGVTGAQVGSAASTAGSRADSTAGSTAGGEMPDTFKR